MFAFWLQAALFTEAVLHICSYKKMFWKYAAILMENTHA